MATRGLFRKNIEPRCTYCARSNPLNDVHSTCRVFGVVNNCYKCRMFKYDPLKRIPPKPAIIRGNFSDIDFLLDEIND